MKILSLADSITAFALLLQLTGCAASGTASHTPATPASSSHIRQDTPPASGALMLRDTDIQPFASRVSWPASEADGSQKIPSYIIESGVNDDGVWVEAKGYFNGTLDDVYNDFIDASVMGPTYLTDDITAENLSKSELVTKYTMHVSMRYLFKIEFDLAVIIESIYNSDGNRMGLRYMSSKAEGTSFIDRIDEEIIIRQQDNNTFSAEFQSLNKAAMNKEKETRQHIESLFSRWEKRENISEQSSQSASSSE